MSHNQSSRTSESKVTKILREDFKIENIPTHPFKELSEYKDQENINSVNLRGNVRLQMGRVWTEKELNNFKKEVFNKPIPR